MLQSRKNSSTKRRKESLIRRLMRGAISVSTLPIKAKVMFIAVVGMGLIVAMAALVAVIPSAGVGGVATQFSGAGSVQQCPLAEGVLGDFGIPKAVVDGWTVEQTADMLRELGFKYAGDGLAFANNVYNTKESAKSMVIATQPGSPAAGLAYLDSIVNWVAMQLVGETRNVIRAKYGCPPEKTWIRLKIEAALSFLRSIYSNIIAFLKNLLDWIVGTGLNVIDGTAMFIKALQEAGVTYTGSNAKELADSVGVVKGLTGPRGFFDTSAYAKLQPLDLIYLYDPASPAAKGRSEADMRSEKVGQPVSHVALYVGQDSNGAPGDGWVVIQDQGTKEPRYERWTAGAPQWQNVVGVGRPGNRGDVECVGEWCAPLPASDDIGFGGWQTPQRPDHNGVDLSVSRGIEIHAVAAGTVIYSDCNSATCAVDGSPSTPGCGWMVEIMHANGDATRYCHLNPPGPYVKKGDVVAAGQVIGLVGTTGHSSGPHLHFQTHTNVATGNRPKDGLNDVDPVGFFASRGIDIKTCRAL